MSFDAIKQELALLDLQRRKKVVSYLVAMEDRTDMDYRAALAGRIEDRNSQNWLTLEALDQRLSISDKDSVG